MSAVNTASHETIPFGTVSVCVFVCACVYVHVHPSTHTLYIMELKIFAVGKVTNYH